MDVTYQEVLSAAARIRDGVHNTPVLRSSRLSSLWGVDVVFKCENLQKVGAFKARGALNAVRSLTPAQLQAGVVTHSSGNHAAALARAASLMGARADVVMPSNAPANKKAAVIGYGATVHECEPALAAREAATQAIIERTGAHLIHPYDDPWVIAGQGTAALEFLEQCPELELIIAPVGGGGLLSGCAIVGQARGVAVIGAEPSGADDAFRSLRSGQLQTMPAPNTIADGLRGALSARTFAIIQNQVAAIVTVSEEEILSAMREVLNTLKLVIEPSAAVAVAALRQNTFHAQKIGIILSGGNVDPTLWSRL